MFKKWPCCVNILDCVLTPHSHTVLKMVTSPVLTNFSVIRQAKSSLKKIMIISLTFFICGFILTF